MASVLISCSTPSRAVSRRSSSQSRLAPDVEDVLIICRAAGVIDPRTGFLTEARFPGVTLDARWPDEALEAFALDARSAVVTLSHDSKIDEPALSAALRSPAFYVGALGSRRTQEKRRGRLREAGLAEADLDRIHGPVGLDLGAKSPAEIALSVAAELTATLRARGDA